MFKLEVLNTALAGKTIPVIDNLTIGSGPKCSIKAQGKDIRETHARFYRDRDGSFFVEVVDPEAHIFVNGKDVLRSELRHQNTLAIGPLRFRIINVTARRQIEHRLDQLLNQLENEAESTPPFDFAKEDLFYLVNKDPQLRSNIGFTIPSKDRFIDQAQAFLAKMVRQSGMDEMKVEAFMTCAKELILNAHRHGHKYDDTKTITIRYRDLGNCVKVTVTDMGQGFDHRSVLEEVRKVTAAAAARKRYQSGGFGGLGFQMITRLADELTYNDKGNEVTFTINKQF